MGSASRARTKFSAVSARRYQSHARLVAVGFLAVIGCVLWNVREPAGASPQLPHRTTSSNPNCSAQPQRPQSVPGVAVVGRGNTFPVVGGIDANGCDSWPYELASSFGPYGSFFAGSGFQAGQHAYEYGTQETTELLDGHQLIRVVDPSPTWLRVYQGFDVCAQATSNSTNQATTCIAPAVERRPDDLVLYIPAGILLAGLLLFVVHYTRPA